MRIVHLTAHLGGGVGKAQAAMRAVDPGSPDHMYLLLESARDRRFADAVAATGTMVIERPGRDELLAYLADADIVQVEFWTHPRLYEALARLPLPTGRYLFWSHISGLAPPLIAPGLTAAADVFVYTSACSLERRRAISASSAAASGSAIRRNGESRARRCAAAISALSISSR